MHASCHWVCSEKVAQGLNTNGAPPPLCSRRREGEAKSPAYTCTVQLTLLVSFASNQTRPGMARIISIASVAFEGRSTGRPAFAICSADGLRTEAELTLVCRRRRPALPLQDVVHTVW
jgi:hypothetical protein